MRQFKVLLVLSLISISLSSCFLSKKTAVKKAPPVKEVPFTTLPSGLKYKIVRDAKGDEHPEEDKYVKLHITTMFEDSLIFNSKARTGGKPVKFQMKKPSFNGDLLEGIMKLTPGDSAVLLVPVDTLKANNQSIQPWMEEGKDIMYTIELVDIITEEELKAEQEAEKARKLALQKVTPASDDSTLQAYFKKNNLEPQKTASGVYYLITKKTENDKAIPGQKVSMNYTGKLMNGQKFDSNTDPQFGHVQPFEFILGRGQVIRGWDIGVAKLRKGEQATLYIPSHLAYGKNSPTEAIPPHSILIFDVELIK